MPITRLGLANPAANTLTTLVTASRGYVAAVIIANKNNQTVLSSVYVVPTGGTYTDATSATIVKDLEIGAGQSFETFRFAVNAQDSIYVKSTIAGTSFSVYGILQADDVGPGDFPTVFRNKTIRGINNTLYVDKGTTAGRGSTAETGYIRFNTETDALEVKTAAGWKTITAVS